MKVELREDEGAGAWLRLVKMSVELRENEGEFCWRVVKICE